MCKYFFLTFKSKLNVMHIRVLKRNTRYKLTCYNYYHNSDSSIHIIVIPEQETHYILLIILWRNCYVAHQLCHSQDFCQENGYLHIILF